MKYKYSKDELETIICRCQEITLSDILKAIDKGAITVNEVKKRTNSGMGLCQGRSCGDVILGLLSRHAEIDLENAYSTYRIPTRLVRLDSWKVNNDNS